MKKKKNSILYKLKKGSPSCVGIYCAFKKQAKEIEFPWKVKLRGLHWILDEVHWGWNNGLIELKFTEHSRELLRYAEEEYSS